MVGTVLGVKVDEQRSVRKHFHLEIPDQAVLQRLWEEELCHGRLCIRTAQDLPLFSAVCLEFHLADAPLSIVIQGEVVSFVETGDNKLETGLGIGIKQDEHLQAAYEAYGRGLWLETARLTGQRWPVERSDDEMERPKRRALESLRDLKHNSVEKDKVEPRASAPLSADRQRKPTKKDTGLRPCSSRSRLATSRRGSSGVERSAVGAGRKDRRRRRDSKSVLAKHLNETRPTPSTSEHRCVPRKTSELEALSSAKPPSRRTTRSGLNGFKSTRGSALQRSGRLSGAQRGSSNTSHKSRPGRPSTSNQVASRPTARRLPSSTTSRRDRVGKSNRATSMALDMDICPEAKELRRDIEALAQMLFVAQPGSSIWRKLLGRRETKQKPQDRLESLLRLRRQCGSLNTILMSHHSDARELFASLEDEIIARAQVMSGRLIELDEKRRLMVAEAGDLVTDSMSEESERLTQSAMSFGTNILFILEEVAKINLLIDELASHCATLGKHLRKFGEKVDVEARLQVYSSEVADLMGDNGHHDLNVRNNLYKEMGEGHGLYFATCKRLVEAVESVKGRLEMLNAAPPCPNGHKMLMGQFLVFSTQEAHLSEVAEKLFLAKEVGPFPDLTNCRDEPDIVKFTAALMRLVSHLFSLYHMPAGR